MAEHYSVKWGTEESLTFDPGMKQPFKEPNPDWT